MNKNILLTSTSFVKSVSNIDNNVQEKFLIPSIKEAQNVHLQEVLGTKLFNKLIELVDTDKINDLENVEYNKLLDEAQYFIAYQAISILCITASVKIGNIGLATTNDTNITQISLKDSFTIQEHYTNKADFYKERLQNYILMKKDCFPELKGNNKYEMNPELNSSASCSIFLGGARGKGRKNNHSCYIGK